MKILGTGLSGLVGSRIVELLSHKYEFENLSLDTGTDITDKESVTRKIENSNASLVLHLAAKTDVDGCEKEKSLGEESEAWKINVLGTQNIAYACQKNNKKLIYFSTDFVFDGKNPPPNAYSEEDVPNPINWYARTKYEGEKIVQNISTPWAIVRLAYPYRAYFQRNDFLRAILSRLHKGEKIEALSDHIFTPTFIDDLTFAIDTLIKKEALGIFHVVGSQKLTPYEAALRIAEAFGLPQGNIAKTTRKNYFKNRAPRPFNLALKNDKIQKLGIKMKTFEEGLKEIKSQMSKIKSTG